jgi:hypothetical protein
MFQDTERHEMKLAQTHPNGAEEWVCPICHRRFILQWPPNYKRVILEEGDKDAIHSGGKNGVHMAGAKTWTEEGDGGADRFNAFPGSEEEAEEEVILSPEMRTALNELDWGDWPD